MSIFNGGVGRSLLSVAMVSMAGALLLGCGGKPTYSGFLSDYDKLKSGSAHKRDFFYRNESVRILDYDALLVDPVQMYFTKDARGQDLNEEALAELTAYFDEQFLEVMSEWFAFTDAPGEGVARVRIAMTDVRPSKVLFDIVPHSKILGLNQGGATIEAEVIDSVTGAQLLAVVDRGWGNNLRLLPEFDTLDDARNVIDQWMRIFQKNLQNWADENLAAEAEMSSSSEGASAGD